jgi:hypothetical protein
MYTRIGMVSLKLPQQKLLNEERIGDWNCAQKIDKTRNSLLKNHITSEIQPKQNNNPYMVNYRQKNVLDNK